MTNIYWLLGLLEGEGSFVISSNKTKRNNATTFSISVEMNEDAFVFEQLKAEFGGSVHKRAGQQTTCMGKKYPRKGVCWQIRKQDEIENLIRLLSPLEWKTKKKQQFDRFCNEFFYFKGLKFGQKQHYNPTRSI